MNTQLRYRVVGAAVLAAVGVIFIPILLDDKRPDPNASRSTVPLAPLPDEPGSPVARVAPDHIREIDQGLTVSPEALPLDGPAEPPVAAPQEPQAERVDAAGSPRQPAPERTAPTAPAAASVAREVATAGPGDTAPSPAWSVQVGSFTQRDNADRLSARLRAHGLSNSISIHDEAGQRSYRVRVGPVASESAAATLHARILREFDIQGIIISDQ